MSGSPATPARRTPAERHEPGCTARLSNCATTVDVALLDWYALTATDPAACRAAVLSLLVVSHPVGSAWLAASSGEPMADLARRVTSPSGTTEAGLKVLDAELPGLVDRTLAAATARSAELAAETRGS